jgi:hypothetical protein
MQKRIINDLREARTTARLIFKTFQKCTLATVSLVSKTNNVGLQSKQLSRNVFVFVINNAISSLRFEVGLVQKCTLATVSPISRTNNLGLQSKR